MGKIDDYLARCTGTDLRRPRRLSPSRISGNQRKDRRAAPREVEERSLIPVGGGTRRMRSSHPRNKVIMLSLAARSSI